LKAMPHWHKGRKAIIAFLTPFLEIPPSSSLFVAWQKVRRHRDKYGLPIETQPNGKPYIDEVVFFLYWKNKTKIKRR
jgi:hypothetical protein